MVLKIRRRITIFFVITYYYRCYFGIIDCVCMINIVKAMTNNKAFRNIVGIVGKFHESTLIRLLDPYESGDTSDPRDRTFDPVYKLERYHAHPNVQSRIERERISSGGGQ